LRSRRNKSRPQGRTTQAIQSNNFDAVKLNDESENVAFIDFSRDLIAQIFKNNDFKRLKIHAIKNPRYPKWASEGDFGFWNSIYKPHLINLPHSDGRPEKR
jgi:hypothetical protein